MEMRDEARPYVAHDAFADDRVEIALKNADARRKQGRRENDRNVDRKLAQVAMRDCLVDDVCDDEAGNEPDC